MPKTSANRKRSNPEADPRLRVRSEARRSVDATSKDAIKAAEEVALAAFGSGLRIAAAFGTVAAKTTSLALASLATGADKFSELVKKEALSSAKSNRPAHPKAKSRRKRTSKRS